MATNFPTSLDSLTNPSSTDQLNNPSHASQHANANDAIEQLQAKVGINGSAVTTSHDYKIAQLEAAITAGVSGTKLIYQDVRNQSGSSLTKGTPVRVTGSDGASGRLLIGAASNSSEGGSSKTFGLLSSTLSNNSNGQVVTNGLLEGVDTTGAVDGDPVWLGVNGAKIFGLVNKPVAPAHLVYLGVVVRGGQQNTGSIFVSIQNGFEVDELHNVLINNTTLQNKNALVYDSTTQLWKNYDLSLDFVSSSDVQNSLGDYIPLNTLGSASGPAELDPDGNLLIPENKIIIEGATADAHELTIQAPDVTSDITVTLPNSTGTLALTTDISTAISNLVNSAPSTLDTLNELAIALGNDANFATTITTALGNKLDSSTAASTYLTQSSASSTYLTQTGASSTYLTQANASSTYLTQSNASSTYAPIASPTFTGTVGGITKSMVGLSNVDNTSDANKPISTATQSALDAKAPLASPALTGTPTAPTATAGTNTTQVATTAFVKTEITNSVQPGSLYQADAPSSPAVGQIWIESDSASDVFDPNIIRRHTFTATAGQTNFVASVSFINGYEQVYFNGLLLLKTTDYTTSGGNTVILTTAAAAGDIVEIVTVTNLNSVNTYTQAEIDSKIATEVNNLVASAPAALNTLDELAQALNDDANFATTVTNSLATKKTETASSISTNTNLTAGVRYFVTSASALTLTLPANPAVNDQIDIFDASGNASTYNITVARNGKLLNGTAGNLIIDVNGGWFTLVFTGNTYGWKVA